MSNKALIVIDVQKGFDDTYWGQRNNLEAESKISKLISVWRSHDYPLVHVQHCSTNSDSPLHPSKSGNDFKDIAIPAPGEKHIKKSVNSAFIGTDLESYLKSKSITDLVVVGLTTDHCVSTTVRMAGNLGFGVTLISDATATFDRVGYNNKSYTADEIHEVHLASLNDEFCIVKTTEALLKIVT